MKRVRFLHGARKPGKSPLLPTDPRRQLLDDDPLRTQWGMICFATFLVLCVAANAILRLDGQLWWLIPAAPLVFVAMAYGYKAALRSVMRKARAEFARTGLIERETKASREPFEIRRKMPLAWPLVLSAIFGTAFVLALWSGNYPLNLMAAVVVLPVLLITWWRAARVAGSIVLTLRNTGLLLGDTEIPWTEVENLRFHYEYRADHPQLVVALSRPMPPTGWMSRLNSALSRGASDRQIHVSLRYSTQPYQVVLLAARDYWQRAVGRERAFDAMRTEVEELHSRQRPFRERSPADRRRTVIAVSIILAIFALGAHGTSTEFLSSASWSKLSGWVALVLTVYGLYRLLRIPGLVSLRNQQSTAAYLFWFVFVVAILTGLNWLAVGRSLPDLITRFAGSPREYVAQLNKSRNSSRGRCNQSVEGEMFRGRFPGRYCPDEREYAALPENGAMRVKVRESWFGMHIDGIEPVDPAFHR